MAQIILNVEDNSLVPKLKEAVKLLCGVISVQVREENEMPGRDTLQALEEAKRGEFAGELDASSKEAIKRSIMEL